MNKRFSWQTSRMAWGIAFIVLAAYIVASGLGLIKGLSIWTVIFTFFFGIWLVKSLLKLDWGGIAFSTAFLAIIYDDKLGITSISPWGILAAALFITIGLNFISPKNVVVRYNGKKVKKGGVVEINENEECFNCDVAFGNAVRYLSSSNLKDVNIDCSFGNVSIYFDNAILSEGSANVNVDNSFGNVDLFVPATWRVQMNVSKFCGSVCEDGECMADGMNTLYINGEDAFGNVVVHYI